MRLIILATLLAASPAAAQIDGTFSLGSSDRDNRVHMNLQYSKDGRGNSNWGRTFERSEFTEVNRNGNRFTFALRRAPGTFTFEGRGDFDRANGWFEFKPSTSFERDMAQLGFRNIDDWDLFVFAIDDLTIDKVKALQGMVSDELDTDGLVRLINHGASVRYVQAMTDLGFRKLHSDEYRKARDHGVTESYVREMRKLNASLSLDELIRTRDHGVTPDFIEEMKDLGYGDLPLSEYVRFRDHGVTPDYVESLQRLGYKNLTPSQLVRLRDHGVTATYVRRAKELLKDTPTVEQIIRLRTRGDIGT